MMEKQVDTPKSTFMALLRVCLSLLFVALSLSASSQYTITQCQTSTDALIASDRNDWSHANLAVVNEGYLHNFDPPALPCGMETASLSLVEVSIELESFSGVQVCDDVPIFGNVLLNCALTNTSVCPIVQDVLTPACGFGGGQSNMGLYTLNLNVCGVAPQMTDVVGVDIVPATELLNSCPTVDDALSSGAIIVVYTVCVSYTYSQDIPADCDNTVSMACDDNDDCTINDQITVDACDNSVVCLPCAGELTSDCSDSISLPCDDGDDCTSNDVVIVSTCDNTVVCEPCAGVLENECTSTIELPCDDGDDCTENDVQSVWSCDNSEVCIPCQGTAVTQCNSVISLPCDDNDDCTENDVEFVDACDNSIVCEPCAGVLSSSCDDTIILPCNDGDDCTIDDSQVVSACDNDFICEPCAGILVTDCSSTIELPCDDGDDCTGQDIVTVSACDNDLVCAPCQGIALESCSTTISLPCDDGDVCTENDVELIDACDNSIICAPCQGTPIIAQSCDDGDCENGYEQWDDTSCECVSVPSITGCTDPGSCNFDPMANCDEGCDYSCEDCAGTPFGSAILDKCGVCLFPDDEMRDISCSDLLYIPNSFTPDGDGLNDQLTIESPRTFSSFEIEIYDRYGQQVFYSSDPDFKWSGSIDGGEYYSISEIYVYRIRYSFDQADLFQKTGSITLVR